MGNETTATAERPKREPSKLKLTKPPQPRDGQNKPQARNKLSMTNETAAAAERILSEWPLILAA